MTNLSGNLPPTFCINSRIVILDCSIKRRDSHLLQSMCLTTRPCDLLVLVILLLHDGIVIVLLVIKHFLLSLAHLSATGVSHKAADCQMDYIFSLLLSFCLHILEIMFHRHTNLHKFCIFVKV